MPKEKSDYRGINVTPVIARAFGKVVFNAHARDVVEENLTASQFAYREGGSCTDALIAIQHAVNQYLDDPQCTAVRLYAMDFSKAFDSAKHDLLSVKLKQLGLSPYITNWYLSFLEGRKQRLLYDGFVGQWKDVNKGTTQGSVSVPHLFTIFLNDLEISLNGKDILFKYADDTSIVSPVWKKQDNSVDIVRTFMEWSEKNCMSSNNKKCKELVMRKKSCTNVFTPVFSIPQTWQLSLLGLILQDSCRFDCHVHVKLIKANKWLFILRSLRKEDYSQAELDHLFSSIVLPSITYGLPVYGASDAELTAMQCFLDRCYKRKYTSKSFSIKHLLEKQDRKVFRKVSGIDRHPLRRLLPKKKVSTYNLRNRTSQYPKVNTDRFKNSYINRLIFKYNLVMRAYF